MKNLLIAACFALTSLAVRSQDIPATAVPAPVIKSFQQQFKNGTDVKWEKKKELYEAGFEVNKVKHKVRLDATGKVVRHKTDLKHTDLPEAVQKKIAAQFAGFKIKDPELVEEGGKTSYHVELKKDKEKKKEVVFGADGTVISQKD